MKKLNCILLIDDDETTNYVNTILINKLGCTEQTKSVTSGMAALEYLKSADEDQNHPQPQLIFLDINMPIMSGWEFIEEYNKLEPKQRGGVLIWMLSTSNNPEDHERALQLGSAGFMAKPLTLAKLTEVVNKHFPDLNR